MSKGWVGTPVRDKNGRAGTIVGDSACWHSRYLNIAFDDGERCTLRLDDLDTDPPDPHGIEWEFNPRQWALLSDHGSYEEGR